LEWNKDQAGPETGEKPSWNLQLWHEEKVSRKNENAQSYHWLEDENL